MNWLPFMNNVYGDFFKKILKEYQILPIDAQDIMIDINTH